MLYFDHLVLGGPNLSELVSLVADATGVVAIPGGPHRGLGTANELIRIDDTTYIELIGPDVNQPDHVGPRPFGVDSLDNPKFVAWAVPVLALGAACEAVAAAGIDPGVPTPMSRVRPDGVVLEWELAIPPAPELAGVMPFMIDWGSSEHPAAALGATLEVADLSFTHPDPAPLVQALAAVIGETVAISAGKPTLSVTLRGPSGELKLA